MKNLKLPENSAGGGPWCTERTLKCRLRNWFRGLIRKRFKNGTSAVRTIRKQDGKRVFHRLDAEITVAGMAVDAIKKRRKINELVAGIDELEIKEIRLARHGWTFGASNAAVNREERGAAASNPELFHRQDTKNAKDSQ